MKDKSKHPKLHYGTVLARDYRPTGKDMERDIRVPVTPKRLAKAVLKGGAKRREKS